MQNKTKERTREKKISTDVFVKKKNNNNNKCKLGAFLKSICNLKIPVNLRLNAWVINRAGKMLS